MTELRPDATVESHDAVGRRAADYFQRRRFWTWSAADQAELDAWLAESALNRVAYLRVEWSAARAAQLAALRPQKPSREGPAGKGLVRRFAFPLLAAASVMLAAALGYPYFRAWFEPPDRVFATNVGGRALLKFSDGTDVELNTDTAVRYRMTTKERTIWLDKGEAYFRVAHNAANPFSVIAGSHRITDIGTEFLVNTVGGLDVVLVQGKAKLASEKAIAPVAMLAAGDEAVARRGITTITKLKPQQLADVLAWRKGELVFRDTKLVDVVREFNRYNDTKLVIADPSIANLRFSAAVKTNHFEDLLNLAQAVLKLRIERQGNNVLMFRGNREHLTKAARVGRSH